MVLHGDDSLNEETEDEGLVDEGEVEDAEPTIEQLIATGELDPSEGAGGDKTGTKEGAPDTIEDAEPDMLPIATDKSLSIRKQIEGLILSGASEDEIIGAGYNKRSVQTVASELRGKGKVRKVIRGSSSGGRGAPIFAKGSPPESIIEGIIIPDIANGQGAIFETGIKFGMSVLVLATRVLQELTGISVMQSKPIIEVAKSMREGEAQAAKNAAGEAAMEAAGIVQNNLLPLLSSLSKSMVPAVPAGTDPLKAMMAETMKPYLKSVMGNVLSQFMPGVVAESDVPQLAEGWTRKSQ